MMKSLKVYDGYEVGVTDDGKVFHNGEELKQEIDGRSGYLCVRIKRSRFSVHRLVASAFIQPLEWGDRSVHVHHINEDVTDNRVENLQVLTQEEHQKLHKQKYPITKECVVCGKEFTPHKTKRKRAQTCSKECYLTLMKQLNKKNEKPIAQYSADGSLIKIWESGRDIVDAMKIDQPNIIKCCKGQIKSYKGFKWQYAEGDIKEYL